TNLEFDMVSSRTDYCSMERLVHVRLGKAYKILEPAGNKRPERMEDAQYIVAVAHRVRDDPYSDNILHLLKRDLLFNHLLVNAVIMLDPALYLNGNVRQLELFRDDVLHLTDIAVLLLFAFRNLFFKLAEQIGHKSLEAQVLGLRPHPANTEPVSEGSINVEGLPRDTSLFFLGQMFNGPHIMEPVGEFYEYDPHILRHGKEHFPEVLGLGVLFSLELNLRQFCQGID